MVPCRQVTGGSGVWPGVHGRQPELSYLPETWEKVLPSHQVSRSDPQAQVAVPGRCPPSAEHGPVSSAESPPRPGADRRPRGGGRRWRWSRGSCGKKPWETHQPRPRSSLWALIQINQIQKDIFEKIRDFHPHWVYDHPKELFSVLLGVKMLL